MGKRRGTQRRAPKRTRGGKGIILDLKKRTQARELRKLRKVKSALPPGKEADAMLTEMRKTADLLVTIFKEEDVDPYAAMSGMSLLLAEMGINDGRDRNDFLHTIGEVYDMVKATTHKDV
jgi:hypothetical protein